MTGEGMSDKRKLATILALDVAGYSRAAERDDTAAAASVRHLRAVIVEIVAPFGGRIFSSAGDGFMLEFPSAASGVQAAMALLEESLSGARPLPQIRIGVHLGDVIVEDNGDLLGHGVNIAARLQALAEPGTAVVSETVRTQVRSAAELPFTPQGRVQLDKMTERLAVYALSPTGKAGFGKIWRRRAARIGLIVGLLLLAALGGYGAWRQWGPHAGAPRMAVLRFENLGEAEPYFAEGVADELTTELAHIKGLDVIARASSFALAGERATPANVARELGATLVLTGSVRQSADMMRVQAQLVEAPGGRQVWADVFEQPVANVFALQRDIAVRVARAVNVRATSAPARRVDPEAYRLYLEAKQRNLSANTIEAYSAVRDLLKAAVGIEPDFAQAWAALARAELDCVFAISFWSDDAGVEPTLALMQPALDAADRAIAIDDSVASAYETKALTYGTLAMWKEATDAFALSEQHGGAYGDWLMYDQLGYMKESRQEAEDSARIDPLASRHWTNLSARCGGDGDLECQLRAARRAIELDPDNIIAAGFLYYALVDNGDLEGARRVRREREEPLAGFIEYNSPMSLQYFTWLTHDSPPPSVESITTLINRGEGYVDPAVDMLIRMKAWDAAAAMLDKWGPKARTSLGNLYRAEAAPLRRTPQFWALMEREGLTPYWRASGHWPDFCAREPGVCPQS
jgi:adenylate cyclase